MANSLKMGMPSSEMRLAYVESMKPTVRSESAQTIQTSPRRDDDRAAPVVLGDASAARLQRRDE